MATLVDGELQAGTRVLSWRGETADGGRSRPGAYFYRFTLDARETRGKLVLLR